MKTKLPKRLRREAEKWFVCTSDCWDDVKRGDLIQKSGPEDHRLFFQPLFRKATAKEIIEHLKNR